MPPLHECPVCISGSRHDLDIRLAAGESIAILATIFDLSERSLTRHKRDHLRHLPVQLRDNPGTILQDLQRAEEIAWKVAQLAEMQEKPDLKNMLLAIAEVRANKHAQVKIAHDLQMMIGGLSQDRWEKIKAAITKALDQHPEARISVIAAIEEVE